MGDGPQGPGFNELPKTLPPETTGKVDFVKKAFQTADSLAADAFINHVTAETKHMDGPPVFQQEKTLGNTPPITEYAANPNEVPENLKENPSKLKLSPELIQKLKDIDWEKVLGQDTKRTSQPHSSFDEKPPEFKKPLSGLK